VSDVRYDRHGNLRSEASACIFALAEAPRVEWRVESRGTDRSYGILPYETLTPALPYKWVGGPTELPYGALAANPDAPYLT